MFVFFLQLFLGFLVSVFHFDFPLSLVYFAVGHGPSGPRVGAGRVGEWQEWNLIDARDAVYLEHWKSWLRVGPSVCARADLSDFGANFHTLATSEVRKFLLSQFAALVALIPGPDAGWPRRAAGRPAAAGHGAGRDVGCRCCATWSWLRPRHPRGRCPCCCWRQ